MEVIDLCSGDGWFTLQLARIARRVVAIDIDPDLLEVARHRLNEGGVANCDFVAFAQKSRDVAIGSMVRNAAHGHWIVAFLIARGQCDFQLTRSRNGIVEEQFVEVAKAKEEQGVWCFLLYGVVLPHHRGEILFLHERTTAASAAGYIYPKNTAASSKTFGSSSFCERASSIGAATISVPRREAI